MTTGAAQVLVVYAATANSAWQQSVAHVPGMTVQQIIESSDFEQHYPNVDWQAGGVGIFGKPVKLSDLVRSGDRVEIYRALVFDPKESRRRRALHRQRQKLTGEKRRG